MTDKLDGVLADAKLGECHCLIGGNLCGRLLTKEGDIICAPCQADVHIHFHPKGYVPAPPKGQR